MSQDQGLPPRSAPKLPIEIHVFVHEGQCYAFDVRNYSILRLNAEGAAVLSLMRDYSLEEILNELASVLSERVINAYYSRFIGMIEEGVFSSKPLPRPAKSPFYRLVMMLAGGCNMGCSYCFERDVPIYQNPNLMTLEKADEILDWYFHAQEGKKAHVQLYGGEPLLNWPVLQHVVERTERWARLNEKELTRYLITNGTLLNEDRIAYLKAHDVTVQVSVDGDAKTHNQFRILKSGKPTMERIEPNIHELARQGVNFNLRAVLTRKNLDPAQIIAGLRSWGAKKVSFEVVATDNCEAQLTNADWEILNEQYFDYVNWPYSSWTALPVEVQNTIVRICDQQKVFYGCGAGVSEVTVAPDGNIYECQRIYRDPYSNVSEGKTPLQLASRFLTMVDDRKVCQDCWARYLCGGGCMQQSHVGHNSDDPLPEYCAMKRTLVEACIVKIDEIRRRNQPQAGAAPDTCTPELSATRA